MSLLLEWRQSARGLWRAPAFALGVVLTLGLALGAGIAVLTLVDRVMLRPLPVREADRLMVLMEDDGRGNQRLVSFPTFEDWSRLSRSFAGMVFVRGGTAGLGPRGARESVLLATASAGYASTLGISPMLGRGFTADEESAGGPLVAMLTESVWVSRFGRDPDIVGRVIHLNDRPTTVIGVIPEAQRYPEWAEIVAPLQPLRSTDPALTSRVLHVDSRAFGRLAPGVSQEQARRELGAVQARLSEGYADPAGAFGGVQVQPLRDAIIGAVTGPLASLAVGMGLMLLLTSANLAGLALLRHVRRSRELSIRSALGATTGLLVRDTLREWVMLAALAGVVGIGLASLLMALVRNTPALNIPRSTELFVDARVAVVGVTLALGLGVLLGMLPVLRARRNTGPVLFGARGSARSGTDARWLRSAVTVVQMGLAVTLMAGAALLLHSFARMQRVSVGYAPAGVTAIDINPPTGRYTDERVAADFYRRLMDAVASIPGVQGAAFINHVPLGGAIFSRVTVGGVAPDPQGADQALYKTASEGYAALMGLHVTRGRWFDRAEVDARQTGVVISERVAAHFWPGVDPIGRGLTVYRSSQARAGFGDAEPSTVIGVVADVHHFGPAEGGLPEVYLPFTREVWGWGSIVMRSALPSGELRRLAEAKLREVDPDLMLTGSGRTGFRELGRDLDRFLVPRRVAVVIALGMAALAMLVASLGLYALVSYSVSQRTGEFGIRMALGATPGAVRWGVLKEGWRLTALGSALGVAGALGTGRVLANQLYETSPRDPWAIAAALGVLCTVLTLALTLPARRASVLEPTAALRSE